MQVSMLQSVRASQLIPEVFAIVNYACSDQTVLALLTAGVQQRVVLVGDPGQPICWAGDSLQVSVLGIIFLKTQPCK